jgi:hypothetical protein
VTLNTRGRAELLEGDAVGAETRLREAAAICGRLRDTWAIRYTITHLADGAALQGDAVRAALLYGVADLLTEKNVSAFPVLRKLSERCRAAAAQQLGTDVFADLCQQGRALPLEEAIALATGPAR